MKAIYPPKPPFAFRVGVVGHRPDRLPEDTSGLSTTIGEVLGMIKAEAENFHSEHSKLFTEDPPFFLAISPLAEGTDRIFFKMAHGLDYSLCCPMPFSKEEYEKDFIDPKDLHNVSLQEFWDCLSDAGSRPGFSVYELDGDRSNNGEAYGNCGQVVLNQSDILLVVWDGQTLGKKGGTEETFSRSLNMGIPVVWNLAGGYQRDEQGTIEPVLALHRQTMDICAQIYGA